jgi:hypothetical protein
VPYLASLVAQRAISYNNFKRNNSKLAASDREKQWENRMQKYCQQQGFYKDWTNPKTGQTKRVVDPYAELREREDAYKPLNRQYESPHQKRWRDFQSFERKLEKSLRL